MWNSSANCCRRILSSQNHLPFFPPAQLLVQLLPHAPSLAWFTFSWKDQVETHRRRPCLLAPLSICVCVTGDRVTNSHACPTRRSLACPSVLSPLHGGSAFFPAANQGIVYKEFSIFFSLASFLNGQGWGENHLMRCSWEDRSSSLKNCSG